MLNPDCPNFSNKKVGGKLIKHTVENAVNPFGLKDFKRDLESLFQFGAHFIRSFKELEQIVL